MLCKYLELKTVYPYPLSQELFFNIRLFQISIDIPYIAKRRFIMYGSILICIFSKCDKIYNKYTDITNAKSITSHVWRHTVITSLPNI